MKKETCSKRIALRILPSMDKVLKARAKKAGRSLSDYIKIVLGKEVKR